MESHYTNDEHTVKCATQSKTFGKIEILIMHLYRSLGLHLLDFVVLDFIIYTDINQIELAVAFGGIWKRSGIYFSIGNPNCMEEEF